MRVLSGRADEETAVSPLFVLIVEDDPNDVELVLRELRRMGRSFRHRSVQTAEEMVAALDEERWDAIICDFRMGTFRAPDALALVHERGLDVPFIIVSGTVGEDVAVEMMRAGAHDYLMKGNLTRLIPAVERELRDAEVRQRRRETDQELRRSYEALRSADEQRRRLLARLVRAQEEERALIADGIHDDSIQVMSACSMRLQALLMRITDPDVSSELTTVVETVDLAIDRLRRLLFELRPRSLEDDGLGTALRLYMQRTDGVTTVLEDDVSEEPPLETRVMLYRIAIEAITNARKHAGGATVRVSLQERDDGYLVSVHDDGPGFEPSIGGSAPGHLGLTSMRERAEMAGGWWRLHSELGEGTTVEFWLPGRG